MGMLHDCTAAGNLSPPLSRGGEQLLAIEGEGDVIVPGRCALGKYRSAEPGLAPSMRSISSSVTLLGVSRRIWSKSWEMDSARPESMHPEHSGRECRKRQHSSNRYECSSDATNACEKRYSSICHRVGPPSL